MHHLMLIAGEMYTLLVTCLHNRFTRSCLSSNGLCRDWNQSSEKATAHPRIFWLNTSSYVFVSGTSHWFRNSEESFANKLARKRRDRNFATEEHSGDAEPGSLSRYVNLPKILWIHHGTCFYPLSDIPKSLLVCFSFSDSIARIDPFMLYVLQSLRHQSDIAV